MSSSAEFIVGVGSALLHWNVARAIAEAESDSKGPISQSVALMQATSSLRHCLVTVQYVREIASPTMPWLSDSRSSSVASMSPLSDSGFSPTGEKRQTSISYILPLMDGATGTIPLSHQHPVSTLLKADAPHFFRAVPSIVRALMTSVFNRKKSMSWKELREVSLYMLVSLIELQLLVTAVPLWLMLPGLVLLPLFSAEVAFLWSLMKLVNREDREFHCAWDGLLDEEDEDGWHHCAWTVVGGLEISEHRLRKETIPRLVQLFGHDMHTFLPYRLGLPLDLFMVFLQRSFNFPTATSTALYKHIRANCVKMRSKQMKILVHNTGALDMAWVMSRLCADLPPGQQLGKFQVYTFGAATAEMTMPLGSHNGHEGHQCDCEDFPEFPVVNHYAFKDDPFARIGVLLGVRHRMEGRVIGAVYGLRNHTYSSGPHGWWSSRSAGKITLDDYLDALFPEGNPRAGALGEVCRIEREVSEMRELAALAQTVREQTKKGKRLSWTALGALAENPSNFRNDRNEMAGVISLEEARRIGKAIEGMFGYENNLLASYVRGVHKLSRDEQQGRMSTYRDGSMSPLLRVSS